MHTLIEIVFFSKKVRKKIEKFHCVRQFENFAELHNSNV